MKANKLIEQSLGAIIEKEYGIQIDNALLQLQATREEFSGQLTLVVFPLLKFIKGNPVEIGNRVGSLVVECEEIVQSFEVVKGFLNLSLTDQFIVSQLQEMMESEDIWIKSDNPQKIVLEYSSPNTNKPLHLGHVRNNLLGYSVAEILKAYGNNVVKVNLINDRGVHICKSMYAWMVLGNGATPQSTGKKGDHFVGEYYVKFNQLLIAEKEENILKGIKEEDLDKNSALMKSVQTMLQQWEAGDEKIREIWQMMNGWVYEGFHETYKALGVDFDQFYYESETYILGKDIVRQGMENKAFYQEADGSVWVDLESDGLDKKILLRSDGTSVYMTQDLGTAMERYKEHQPDEMIYVVGNEQDYHFKVLKLAFKRLGMDWWERLHHLSYGMVELPDGKLKSREGKTVDADELMADMIQLAKEKTEELGKRSDLTEGRIRPVI